ncbi:MAG: RidA family protein [Gemmatimonadaceae bacterium]
MTPSPESHRPSATLPLAALALAATMIAGPAARPLAAQQPTTESTTVRAEYNEPSASGTLSRSVKVGQTIYLAGVLGTRDGALVPGGIVPETKQALTNMKGVLERAGATMDDVVQCTVFVADMKDVPAMNEAYIPFFARHRPARTALAASGLALDARIEIQCVAVAGAGGN